MDETSSAESSEDITKLLEQSNISLSRICHYNTSQEALSSWCPLDFDTVLCWPETPPNTLAVLPCLGQLNGISYDTRENATRMCLSNGTWAKYSNYTSCRELNMGEATDLEITSTIYFAGYTLSLVALSFAVYIFWRFKDLKCLRNTIHMNLMCSYILADFVWILMYRLQVHEANHSFCVFLIILVHYFHLTNFFWMFVEGLYLYILVVKTFERENIKPRIYAIIGWGGPVLFVMIWGFAKAFGVQEEDQQNGSTSDYSCPWRPHPFDWIYQGPAITVLVINVIFLCVIMWVLITKLRSANNVETQQYRKAAKALLVLIPLLGVTYILVIVGPTEGISKHIYDGVRATLLSTQGLTVALFYCFLNGEVKNTLRHHYNSWSTRRTLGSRRTRFSTSKDWSSHARDSFRDSLRESVRLYQTSSNRKRGSTCSTGTTTTVVVVPYPRFAHQTRANFVVSTSDSGG